MYYRLKENIALRKWRFVDRAVYEKGVDVAFGVPQRAFDLLLECDAEHDIEPTPELEKLLEKGYIEECRKGDPVDPWSLLREYDNYYFPKMNLMVTGKCNLNCLHCFNAKDNAPLNSQLSYEDVLNILDQAASIGVHAFTLTGGEPLVHPRFLDIVKAIYERNMHVFELNTNGILLTQGILDAFKAIGCDPLVKISYDGVGYHNWIRQHPKAEERTLEAIRLCIENGFRVKAQVQVNRKNVHIMMETAKRLAAMGVEEMRIIRTTEAPRWEKNSPNSSLGIDEYYEKMLAFAADYMKSGMRMDVDVWQLVRLHPDRRAYELVPVACNKDEFNVRIPMCKGNRGMIAVSSSGEVVPCLQMSGYFLEKGISLGNVLKTPLRELVKDSPYLDLAMAPLLKQILKNDKCGNCDYYKACTGGCPALGLLYSQTGDFYHEDITKCAFFEHGWYEKSVAALGDWELLNPLDI